MRCWHRGHVIRRSLLDTAHADSGDPRSGGLSGERQTRQKRTRATYGRVRLSVVAVYTFRRFAAYFVPASTGRLRDSITGKTSRQSCGDSAPSRPTYAKGARPDEPAIAPHHRRHHRYDRSGDSRRYFTRRTRRGETGPPATPPHPSQPRDDCKEPGWRLPARTPFHSAPICCALP